MDIQYNHGRTTPCMADRAVASRTDGSATYWQLSRGFAGRSTHHVIFTADGQVVRAKTAASAFKKLAAI